VVGIPQIVSSVDKTLSAFCERVAEFAQLSRRKELEPKVNVEHIKEIRMPSDPLWSKKARSAQVVTGWILEARYQRVAEMPNVHVRSRNRGDSDDLLGVSLRGEWAL